MNKKMLIKENKKRHCCYYYYNENGELIRTLTEEIFMNKKRTTIKYYEYEYFENKKIRTEYDEDKRIKSISEIDNNGNIIKVSFPHPSNRIITYDYDNKNRVISVKSYKNDKLISSIQTMYDDKNKTAQEIINHIGHDEKKYEYELDYNGNIKLYSQDEKLFKYKNIELFYNNISDLIIFKKYDENNKLICECKRQINCLDRTDIFYLIAKKYHLLSRYKFISYKNKVISFHKCHESIWKYDNDGKLIYSEYTNIPKYFSSEYEDILNEFLNN